MYKIGTEPTIVKRIANESVFNLAIKVLQETIILLAEPFENKLTVLYHVTSKSQLRIYRCVLFHDKKNQLDSRLDFR